MAPARSQRVPQKGTTSRQPGAGHSTQANDSAGKSSAMARNNASIMKSTTGSKRKRGTESAAEKARNAPRQLRSQNTVSQEPEAQVDGAADKKHDAKVSVNAPPASPATKKTQATEKKPKAKMTPVTDKAQPAKASTRQPNQTSGKATPKSAKKVAQRKPRGSTGQEPPPGPTFFETDEGIDEAAGEPLVWKSFPHTQSWIRIQAMKEQIIDNAQIIWNASNRVDWIVITTDHGIEEGAQDAIENRFSAALTHIKPRGPQSPSLDPKLVKKDLITESGRFYSRERALMDLLEFTEQETLGWCEDNWDKPVNSDDSDGGEGQEELQDE